jgi:hypothetical protein
MNKRYKPATALRIIAALSAFFFLLGAAASLMQEINLIRLIPLLTAGGLLACIAAIRHKKKLPGILIYGLGLTLLLVFIVFIITESNMTAEITVFLFVLLTAYVGTAYFRPLKTKLFIVPLAFGMLLVPSGLTLSVIFSESVNMVFYMRTYMESVFDRYLLDYLIPLFTAGGSFLVMIWMGLWFAVAYRRAKKGAAWPMETPHAGETEP